MIYDTYETLDIDIAGYNANIAMVHQIYDDHILISLYDSESNQSMMCGYDISTGKLSPLDLWYKDSDGVEFMVTICSETQENFFVLCGAEYVEATEDLPDGSPYTFDAKMEKFGLISKTDFWNSVPNIAYFEDTGKGMIDEHFYTA